MERKVLAVCTSSKKGTVKTENDKINLICNYGVENDAHAGTPLRQVSLLSNDDINDFKKESGLNIPYGAFGENIVLSGPTLNKLPLGSVIDIGKSRLRITQIGKECHSGCTIKEKTGKCIMPLKGVFAKVLNGGEISKGELVKIYQNYRIAIICLSDKASRGERIDESTPLIQEYAQGKGWNIMQKEIIPDEKKILKQLLTTICDLYKAEIIITTGGTGLTPRDITPDVTKQVIEREVPGVAEYTRMRGSQDTPFAPLSCGVCGIRRETLILNLPGSPKAVKQNLSYIDPFIAHAIRNVLDIKGDCGTNSK